MHKVTLLNCISTYIQKNKIKISYTSLQINVIRFDVFFNTGYNIG